VLTRPIAGNPVLRLAGRVTATARDAAILELGAANRMEAGG